MPYADYGGFGQDYFDGNTVASGHAAGYDDYRHDLLPFSGFAQEIRNKLDSTGFNLSQVEMLVAGCAFGHTVQHLVDDHGVDAWGMDISQYAVDNAPSGTADRIIQGDLTVKSDIQNVAQTKGGGKFDVIVGEGVLTCMSGTEASGAASNARSEAQGTAMWSVYDDSFGVNTDWYNSKSLSGWKSVADPNNDDVWFSRNEYYG